MKKIIVFLLVVITCPAWSETSMLSTSVKSESTSDGFDATLSQIHWQNHRRDPVWPYQNEAPSAFDLDVTGNVNSLVTSEETFSGYSIKVNPGVKFSPFFSARAGLGYHQVEERESGDELAGMIYEGTVFLTPNETNSLILNYTDDFAYTETFHRDLSLDLRSQSYSANFTVRPFERFQIRGSGRYASISDGNEKAGGNMVFLYGIFTSEPWWWAGVITEYLSYKQDAEAYWSPEKFVSYGLYSESSFPLVGILSGSLTAQITRSQENNFEPGWSRMAAIGLALGKRESFQLQVAYNYLKSTQEASSWSSSGLQAKVSSSF